MKTHIAQLVILAGVPSAFSQATEMDPLKIYDKLDTRIYDHVLTYPDAANLSTEYRCETNQIVFLDVWSETNTPVVISATNEVFRVAPLSLSTNAGFARTNDYANVQHEKPKQEGSGSETPDVCRGTGARR